MHVALGVAYYCKGDTAAGDGELQGKLRERCATNSTPLRAVRDRRDTRADARQASGCAASLHAVDASSSRSSSPAFNRAIGILAELESYRRIVTGFFVSRLLLVWGLAGLLASEAVAGLGIWFLRRPLDAGGPRRPAGRSGCRRVSGCSRALVALLRQHGRRSLGPMSTSQPCCDAKTARRPAILNAAVCQSASADTPRSSGSIRGSTASQSRRDALCGRPDRRGSFRVPESAIDGRHGRPRCASPCAAEPYRPRVWFSDRLAAAAGDQPERSPDVAPLESMGPARCM